MVFDEPYKDFAPGLNIFTENVVLPTKEVFNLIYLAISKCISLMKETILFAVKNWFFLWIHLDLEQW